MGAGAVSTRRFRADLAEFVVGCPSPKLRALVEAAFLDLPSGHGSGACHRIELQESATGDLAVAVDGTRQFGFQHPSAAVASITTCVTRLSLDADPGRLHLHCAALERDGRGILISARSGTGKTTLAAALAVQGWTYASDESVAVDPELCGISTFPKPLLIKPGGTTLVPGLQDAAARLNPDPSGNEASTWTVPASGLGAAITDHLEANCVVILNRPLDGALGSSRCRPIHPADAVVALMQQTMDAERFGRGAALVLAEIAARCTCVALDLGAVDDAVESVNDALSRSSASLDVRELPSTADQTVGWRTPPGVTTVCIGDRCVIHDAGAGGVIVSLDAAGTAAWLALHGEAPTWWLSETLTDPAIQQFYESLSALGLLEAHSIATGLAP